YFFSIFGFDNFLFADGFDEVWPVIKAPIGYDGHDVGHLQWGDAHFALANRQGYVITRSPPGVAIAFGIVVGRRQQAVLLARQIDAQWLSDAELHGRIAPQGIGLRGRHVAVVDHPGIRVAEVGIARTLHRRYQGNGAVYVRAAHNRPSAAITISAGAIENGAGLDEAGLLGSKCGYYFEHRSRGVLGLDGADKHRLVRVVQQFHVVVPTLAAHHHIGVVAWTAHKREDFAGGGFNSHHAADFVAHQLFGENLQVFV